MLGNIHFSIIEQSKPSMTKNHETSTNPSIFQKTFFFALLLSQRWCLKHNLKFLNCKYLPSLSTTLPFRQCLQFLSSGPHTTKFFSSFCRFCLSLHLIAVIVDVFIAVFASSLS
ncbi:Uncharacterized protein APZ42_007875, partial [Daphnia magna]